MRRILVSLVILWLLSPAAMAEPAGVVAREVRDKVGVFELESAGDWKPGDILTVLRGGEAVGEAVVLAGGRIMAKGALEARRGDEVRFARRPAPVAAPRVAGSMTRTQAMVAPEPSRPARLTASRGSMYIANTGYVRVDVRVRNDGGQASQPTVVQCRWQTFGGEVGIVDSQRIPSLEPGEAVEFTLFSMVRADPNVITTLSDTVHAEGRGMLRPVLVVQGYGDEQGASSSASSGSRYSEPARFPPPGSTVNMGAFGSGSKLPGMP